MVREKSGLNELFKKGVGREEREDWVYGRVLRGDDL